MSAQELVSQRACVFGMLKAAIQAGRRRGSGALVLQLSSRDHLPSLTGEENICMDPPNPHLQLLNAATQRREAVKWIFVWRAEESGPGVDGVRDNRLCLLRTISQIRELLQTVVSPC